MLVVEGEEEGDAEAVTEAEVVLDCEATLDTEMLGVRDCEGMLVFD